MSGCPGPIGASVLTYSTIYSVTASLKALLNEIIDYAGMYPPASLSLDDAASKFAQHRRSAHSWMLARFIVPTARLADLPERSTLLAAPEPLHLALLATGGATADAFLQSLADDLSKVRTFLDEHGSHATIDQFEARLPAELLETDAIHVGRFLRQVTQSLKSAGLASTNIFVEIPANDFLHQTVPLVAGAAAQVNRERESSTDGRSGLKIRTGGTEPSSIPPVEQVALFIAECLRMEAPFKATAGLHHPFRRYDDNLGSLMHGFINVFGAASLASMHELDEGRIAEILMDDDPSHFQFSQDAFSWQELSVPLAVIERVRTSSALSFGSCSFDEPVEDLEALGLI